MAVRCSVQIRWINAGSGKEGWGSVSGRDYNMSQNPAARVLEQSEIRPGPAALPTSAPILVEVHKMPVMDWLL